MCAIRGTTMWRRRLHTPVEPTLAVFSPRSQVKRYVRNRPETVTPWRRGGGKVGHEA